MIKKEDRKLEKINKYADLLYLKELYSDTLMLEDVFADMQMLISDITNKLQATDIDNTTIECIYTLQQVCITILEKINNKI